MRLETDCWGHQASSNLSSGNGRPKLPDCFAKARRGGAANTLAQEIDAGDDKVEPIHAGARTDEKFRECSCCRYCGWLHQRQPSLIGALRVLESFGLVKDDGTGWSVGPFLLLIRGERIFHQMPVAIVASARTARGSVGNSHSAAATELVGKSLRGTYFGGLANLEPTFPSSTLSENRI